MYQQAKDYQETVVKPVLLPAYLASDASDASKRNISAAVAEHDAFLATVGEQ